MRRVSILFGVALAACNTPAEPTGWQRVVGWADPTMSSIQAIRFPVEIFANEPFTVTINTIGSSSCTRPDGARAVVNQSLAVLTPYDFVAPANSICTEDLHAFPRDVSVTFSTAGNATLRLNTRRRDGLTSTYDFTVQVRAR